MIKFILLVFISVSLQALEHQKSINVNGKNLVLNGSGIRQATWFKINVYRGFLYLEKKTSSLKELLKTKQIRRIEMTFLRDVDQESLIKGWNEAFSNRPEKKDIQQQIDIFNKAMKDIKEGQSIKIDFLKDSIVLDFNGQKTTISSVDFMEQLFSLWFVNPIDTDLKDELIKSH